MSNKMFKFLIIKQIKNKIKIINLKNKNKLQKIIIK